MNEKIRLGVIFGGRSGEHEVSLASARSVLSVLDPEKYEVIEIGISHEGEWWSGKNALKHFEAGNVESLYRVVLLPEPGKAVLYKRLISVKEETLLPIITLDAIFPVLHGSFGEDGTLQGLLELADIAFVGAGVLGSSVSMDKGLFKEVMRSQNIPIVDWIICTKKEIEKILDAVILRSEKLGNYPLFVKPANLGSSVGISKCKNRSDLGEGLQEAARFDRRILVEKGVNAREIEISVLGNEDPQVSLPGEVRPSDEFYSYRAKYIDGKSELLIPAHLNPEQIKKIQTIALQTYRAIDCAGMARIDFLMDKENGNLFVNEVNTIPGFTSISMYPKLWEASGLPYAKLVDRLVDLGLERKQERDQIERKFNRS